MANSSEAETGGGRRVLVSLGLLLVCVVAFVGYAIGDNWAKPGVTVKLFGVLSVPVTGFTVAAYSTVIASVILGVLFGAAEYLTRVETQ